MAETTAHRIPADDTEIAVEVTEGAPPSVLWLGGFRSDMIGGKAMALAGWATERGRRCVRFDYRGHGASGGAFEDYVVSDWLADAERVYAGFCEPGTIAVGSSMGGWIALLMARRLLAAGTPLGGLVLVAPAADFTERLMWPRFSDEMREMILRDGRADVPTDYGDPYPVTRRLFEDGRDLLLYGEEPIRTGCPVHILQGVEDPDVPYGHVLELVERLAQDDVVLTLIKDGDHRLSRDADIARLLAAVAGIAD